MTSRIESFDAESIDRFAATDGRAARYVASLISGGARSYVDNVEVDVRALTIDGTVLPLLVNDQGGSRAEVCSSYAHYIDYTLEEVAKRHPLVPPQVFKALLWPLAAVLKTGRIDRAVFVNNWLLTTNPRLDLSGEQVRELTTRLVEECPRLAIVFRSLNANTDEATLLRFQQNGYRLVRSRRIYLLDARTSAYLEHQNARWDRRFLARTSYRVVRDHETLAAHTARLARLYRDLYLARHSALNPHFNERFFALTLKERTLTYRALEQNGRIDGFVAYFADERVMTAVLLGYDLAPPKTLGLYRLLIALLTAEAAEAGLLLNLGGGTGRFKVLRGAVPAEEFDAVYDAHLSPHRRFSWSVLQTATRRWSRV